jgi:AcrR family transcriptional regulator
MPRSETANQERRELQRANIIQAAHRVFARQGIGATMDDIADEAAVSHGLAYRYFPTKDSLTTALVDEALEAGRAGLVYFEQLPGGPEDRLTRLITVLVESRHERPEFYLLLDHIRASPGTPKKLRSQIRQQKDAFLGLLRSLVVDAQTRGTVHADDPDQLIVAISAILEGLTRLALNDPDQFRRTCPDPAIVLRMLFRQRTARAKTVKR